jgi:hypothetical protein
MDDQPCSEVGRELRVSELKPRTIVVLERPDSAMATMWVAEVLPRYVIFLAGVTRTCLISKRTGPHLEQVTDDTGRMLRVYEYLGEP